MHKTFRSPKSGIHKYVHMCEGYKLDPLERSVSELNNSGYNFMDNGLPAVRRCYKPPNSKYYITDSAYFAATPSFRAEDYVENIARTKFCIICGKDFKPKLK